MQQYLCIIAYDGTEYAGWQVQPHQHAVANVVQNVFSQVFGQTIKLTGASRTDAGVHALGQVASFSCNLNLSCEKILNAWNNRLPPDILIRSLHNVENFHPQRNVRQKTYRYHFFLDRPLPFVQRYGYFHRYQVDIKKLQEAFKPFIGTHDFRSFCTGDEQETTVRTIDSISLQYMNRLNMYRIEIKGPAFLHFMIRRIVGACLEVASRDFLSVDILQKVLDEKDPEQTLPNAPAQGLLLYKIVYENALYV